MGIGELGIKDTNLLTDPELIQLCKNICIAAHSAVGQKRKYSGEDYYHHPIAVAQSVAQFGGSIEQICAAYLHDVLEDTEITPVNLLFASVPESIRDLVKELTDSYTKELHPTLNRKERNFLEREFHYKKMSEKAAFVKLHDLADNTADIVSKNIDFACVYLPEKQAILDIFRQDCSETFKTTLATETDFDKSFHYAEQVLSEGFKTLEKAGKKLVPVI